MKSRKKMGHHCNAQGCGRASQGKWLKAQMSWGGEQGTVLDRAYKVAREKQEGSCRLRVPDQQGQEASFGAQQSARGLKFQVL